MFKKLFFRKTKIEVLQEEYKRLLELSYELSTVNRLKSYKKMAEAEAKLEEIEQLQKKN